MTHQAVTVRNLHFKYSTSPKLFDGFSIQINEGERYGIFGPNGAGKTTLMSIITGIIPLTMGSIQIFDYDLQTDKKKAQMQIGLVPQDFSFYDVLTPMENLEFFGIWSNVDKKDITTLSKDVLQVLGLYDVRNKNVRRFSGGMKRRMNLAIGVIHNPKILFLDEPTTGVDVQSRHAILEFLLKLNQQGTTIIYTSHHLREAEDLCDNIALIDNGKIISQGKSLDLIDQNKGGLEGLYMDLTGKAYRD